MLGIDAEQEQPVQPAPRPRAEPCSQMRSGGIEALQALQPSRHELKVFYDGACSICTRKIDWLKERTGGRVLYIDISEKGFQAENYNLRHDDLLARIHGMRPDGRVISGLEVFRELYEIMGRGWLLRPTGWPLIRNIADWGYELVARNRPRRSGGCDGDSCGVKPTKSGRKD